METSRALDPIYSPGQSTRSTTFLESYARTNWKSMAEQGRGRGQVNRSEINWHRGAAAGPSWREEAGRPGRTAPLVLRGWWVRVMSWFSGGKEWRLKTSATILISNPSCTFLGSNTQRPATRGFLEPSGISSNVLVILKLAPLSSLLLLYIIIIILYKYQW